jgi:undecaprenyl-diphosphatase
MDGSLPRAAAQPRGPHRIRDRGMNPLDFHVITFLNQFAHRSWTFDYFVLLIGQNYVLKTGVITALLGWTWFRKSEDSTEHRRILVFAMIASCVAVLLNRMLALVVPFRVRPLHSPELDFVLPYAVNPQNLLTWSGFPSDNATLFFGLAAGIFLVSRRAGILAFGHVLLAVAFARVYLGFHHPTDILAGALLGVGAVSLVIVPAVRTAVTRVPMWWLEQDPPSFHAALFVLVFLIATTFEPLYPLAGFALATAKATISVAAAFYRTIILADVPR